MGEVVLEHPLSVQLSWMVEEKPQFSNAQRRTVTVLAGNTWKSKPSSDRFDLRFKQLNGRLFFDYFYGPCRITDLGAGSLDGTLGFDVGFLTFEPPQGELEAGHVYLFQQEAFSSPYWVLLRIDKIITGVVDSAKASEAERLNKQQKEDAVLALKQVLRVQDEGFNSKLLFVPRSNLLAVAFNDRTIRLVGLPKGNPEGILIGLDAPADCLAVSADGKKLFAGTCKGSVFMWTGRDPPLKVCSSGEWPVTALAAAPNGERIVWVCNGKYGLDQKWATPEESAVCVEVASGKKLWGTKVGRGDFQAAAFEGEGRTVALVQPTKVALLDSAAGRVIRQLQQDEYPSGPLSVAMSRDGRVCAVGYAPSRVGLWDTTEGKFLRLLPAHQNWVVSLAFTTDGALIATSAGDSSASIWKVATGTEIGRVRFGDGEAYVLSVSFSEDARWLAAGRRGEYIVLESPGVPLQSRASSER